MCTFILVSSDQFTVPRSLLPSASKSNWTDLKRSTEEIRSTDCEIVSSLHLPTQRQVQVAMGCTHVCKETGNGLCLAFLYYQLVAKRKKKKDICRLIQLIYLLFSLITAQAGRRISTQLAKWLLLKAEGSHSEFVSHFPHIECLFTISDQFWQMTKECQCGHFELLTKKEERGGVPSNNRQPSRLCLTSM